MKVSTLMLGAAIGFQAAYATNCTPQCNQHWQAKLTQCQKSVADTTNHWAGKLKVCQATKPAYPMKCPAPKPITVTKTITKKEEAPEAKTVTVKGPAPAAKTITITAKGEAPEAKTVTVKGEAPPAKTVTVKGEVPAAKTVTVTAKANRLALGFGFSSNATASTASGIPQEGAWQSIGILEMRLFVCFDLDFVSRRKVSKFLRVNLCHKQQESEATKRRYLDGVNHGTNSSQATCLCGQSVLRERSE
ncbi:hypothetical protein ABW20_dc0101375 [Dactylellina cionopaga]|nr:hypothetical protein ABW20_dc0101375 [Dactylellina cionopaga]